MYGYYNGNCARDPLKIFSSNNMKLTKYNIVVIFIKMS